MCFIPSTARQETSENKSAVLIVRSICCNSANYQLWIHNDFFQSFSRLLCISEEPFVVVSLQPLCLHRANMLNRRVWCTFPYPRWSVLMVTLTLQVINTGASVCQWSSEQNADSGSISSIPPSVPSVSIAFLFNPSIPPPSLPNPCFSPNCHAVITAPRSLKQAVWRLDPLPFTCTPMHTHAPPCHPSCCPRFHCTILLYKKYNPIDPKSNGKRWSVNIRVLNNGCSVLLRGGGRMGSVRDGGGVFSAQPVQELYLICCCERGEGGGGGGKVWTSIIYQIYYFLVLLLPLSLTWPSQSP